MLALLQAHPGIAAPALAARLGVTERTARRDVARLRELGYRIDAEAGRTGGYRLAAGGTMPPLLLDADEVAAVALGLRTAVAVEGLDAAAVTALAKLAQLVPAQWRSRLDALAEVQAPRGPASRVAELDVLVALALACRWGEAVRIRHRARGSVSARAVDLQPLRVLVLRRRWYLVGCPRGSSRWHTYALDRIERVQPLATRFPTPEPPADAAVFVSDALAQGPWRHRVRVRVHTSADAVRDVVDASVATVVPVDDDTCELHFGADDLHWAARWLVYLDFDIDVLEPPELLQRMRALGQWITERY